MAFSPEPDFRVRVLGLRLALRAIFLLFLDEEGADFFFEEDFLFGFFFFFLAILQFIIDPERI